MAALGMAALGDTDEHRRSVDDPSRSDLLGVAGDPGLHLEPLGLRDDDRCRDLLPFLFGPLDTVTGVVDTVEVPPAISRAGQDVAQVGDVPFAPAQRRAGGVEVDHDLLVAHGALADAEPLHAEDLPNRKRLRGLDDQPLLGFGPAHLGDLGSVAERRDGTVPETGLGIALHGVAGELGGLARLIFVEVEEDRADQVALRVVTDLLRNRDQANAGPLQFAAVMFEQIVIAEQPREAVDTDLGNAGAGTQRVLEQRLQAGAVVGRARQPAIPVYVDQLDTETAVMLAEPLLLIVETDPAVRLALGRDPNVTERLLDTFARHVANLLRFFVSRTPVHCSLYRRRGDA